MYIIRTAFWLSVVVLLLPIGNENRETQSGEPVDQTSLSAGDAINAAIATVGDVAGLCTRQPEVCEAGSAVWETFQVKARYGAEMVYRWARGDEETLEDDTADNQVVRESANRQDGVRRAAPYRVSENIAPVHTGSTTKPKTTNGPNGSGSRNTLRIEDLIPEWKGPKQQIRA